jgi:hypothetical protein
MAEQSVAQTNMDFLNYSLAKNYSQPNQPINAFGQTVDIEIDSVPGWADSMELSVGMNLALTYTTAPSWSQFAPWNFFTEVQLSLGGGPFQRVSPYFYYLREVLSHDGWTPNNTIISNPAAANLQYVMPAIATGNLQSQFTIRIPLQAMYGTTIGLLPLGSASTKAKLRLTVAPSFYGTDQFLNPLYGGTGVTVAINSSGSYISPNINYLTQSATGATLPNPVIGSMLNVQQRATQFVGAGALTPIKFPDPFRYLRLYHIVIDGNGAPNSTAVTNFEMDLTPGYPQYNYNTPSSLASYYYKVRRMYNTDLPAGVLVFDFFGGSDPRNPNGTQIPDASVWQTMQTQIQVAAGTAVGSPGKIITFAEALSPVNF